MPTKETTLKIVGIIVVMMVILNLVLAALRVTSWLFFWAVLAIAALFAYGILPRLKKK